jgi:D-amino peptidase
MKIMISADMEGATGVTWGRDVEPRGDEWHRFRTLFTADVNAVALGLLDAGVDDVLVNEAHASMRNLVLEELDERVRLLTGRHKPLGMMQGIEGVDGVAFVGYHAGASDRGVLAHTYLANSITGVWLDGVPASEGYLNAHLAAEYGVPVILVTGDDRTCLDARRYAPQAQTVAVKEYVSRYAAICLPPARTTAMQRAAAATAASSAGRFPGTTAPHRIEMSFDATHLADAAAVVPTVELVGECRIGYDSDSMLRAMKTFRVVSSIASSAREDVYG